MLGVRCQNTITPDFAIIGIVALVGAIAPSLGCDKKDKPAEAPPAASQPAASQPAASPPAEKAPAGDGNLHCDQFLSKDELTTMGMAMRPNSEFSQEIMVRCSYDGGTAMIWRGDHYGSSVLGSYKAQGSAAQPDDGPKVGAETVWLTMSGSHIVGFLPANKKFTATVTGGDKAKVEKLANALNARFEKM